ncbi:MULTISPECIES: CPBP family glutamic-type intramembrane protease [Stenotrophomonas]|uniref:CPBP family intramembrane metalloprotease n=1 Tax=Stenotrophomonas aracearum TaxID=3003272 RepID=A0ABY9YD66_9GAMM|nr:MULTISPECIES: CPBP family glutamic-type intramembrane protease [unclassified Stenotrophomonas]WNH48822.1 CPBP family intramembrane metalloprotease [Stenotrophomonas sp. A5588]
MASFWRPVSKPENRIFVAAIATIAVGAGQGLLNAFDVFGSKAMTELAAFLVCMWLFPREERAAWSGKLVLILVSLGLLGGALWVAFVGYPDRHNPQWLTWDKVPVAYYLLGLVTGCIVAPLFEEKVVRHLLRSGSAHYLGRFLASLGVSALFAWVHTDAMVSAFLVSVALCASVYSFKLDTLQRAVIHGVINLVITHWVPVYPNL